MRVIEEKKNELVLIDKNNQVLAVPNTFYFFLKYARFEGNKISCILGKSPLMKVYETQDKEFVCSYNNMQITVQGDKKTNDLCEILIENHTTQNPTQYINFFCKIFAEKYQSQILQVFFAPYRDRIEKYPFPEYVIDGLFGIDKYGNTYVSNPSRKKFPWDEISMEVRGDIQEYKIIESFDGRDLIMDAELQKFVTKAFYLLSAEKKNDAMFMVQLPKKVQRWLEKGDLTAEINVEIETQKEPEIIVPKNYGYFPTPPEIVEQLISHADLAQGMKILEPSAGQGHILDFLKEYDVTCCELFYANQEILKEKGYKIACGDFMEFEEYEKFDRVIMNPPFNLKTDIDHVNHAYAMLKKGGKLVSIMASGIKHREDKKTKKLRELIESNGYIIDLAESSFHSTGTNVNTVIVVMEKN